MTTITLAATPKDNGYQATVTFSHGVSMSSAETYPSIAEAVAAAAKNVLDMPERLDALDRSGAPITSRAAAQPT
jgi:tripartite-type tricarboxylate transporter receptor subunit TctC